MSNITAELYQEVIDSFAFYSWLAIASGMSSYWRQNGTKGGFTMAEGAD
jgi:hypothetical protein